MNKLYSLYVLTVMFLVGCSQNEKNENVDGFDGILYEYDGPLEPKVLKEYPCQIDTAVVAFFIKKGIDKNKLKISVQHPLAVRENNQAHVDTNSFIVYVKVQKNQKKNEVWRFDFNKFLENIGQTQLKDDGW
ncbi:MAG: hypothetical protein A3D31_01075 [Candidatus Fluviicola riflensis]|nr:MAG: hypothetical protein CHH17_04465 [Candidatus Fluviicola riflensis]OGS76198.1 MAG: hypothetical protein A3D31_01075 [Candidatus Fluviicola riflensis]OGS83258.1 MAG: hypothetical protein A2724_00765 [Fluviicola sp. RIFCSPHIGHO2_01_FULL_43_53]OGS83730.1 MAG: hypothetical protein A3E30_17680 [Fluviicola sp. RIFCSPHIGHO2_12_FULL_43_24]